MSRIKTGQEAPCIQAQQAASHQEHDAVLAKQKTARAELVRAEAMMQALQAKQRQVLARIEQARAEVANAQVSLGYATLRAPLDGVVLERRVEVGTLAAPGVSLLTLEDPRGFRLEAHVPESQVGGMALGMQVAGLRSGIYGKARFPTGERVALLVPQSALLERGQLQHVYVVEEREMARLRLVKTGKAYGDRVEILAGLKGGDMVVVVGLDRLFDGAPVEVNAR